MLKHLDFWSRLGSLVLAVVALCVYQAHALQWQAAEDENKQQIAEAQAKNAAAEGGAVSYADGTYTGSGDGFGDTVSVEVTVSGGKITAIDIVNAANEDAAYLDKAKGIIDSMISANSPEVDTISGATFSSTGIKTAVQQALEGAAACGKEKADESDAARQAAPPRACRDSAGVFPARTVRVHFVLFRHQGNGGGSRRKGPDFIRFVFHDTRGGMSVYHCLRPVFLRLCLRLRRVWRCGI